MFAIFFLVSLAVIASTAALVALIGQAGMGPASHTSVSAP